MDQLADLEAAKGLLRSVGLRAVVNPLYECGETVELVRPRDPNLALWLFNATAGGQILVTDFATDNVAPVANFTAAVKMVAAVESGLEVCA
jgi:hypothetical protein